ncbi:Imm49 family immunity protein [Halorientalis brevis]|uniref:Imm49 family immunity protein n=1 Tax=Halorientalis brevis TaxID=1126241 RepID=A0ABD6C7J4_9EURY|nr:Imm49 family immunity protein [Halorientalis brevis]
MSSNELSELVESERERLLDGKDGIDAAVVTRPTRAQTVAVGLLALDDVDGASDWFRALVEEWPIYANSKWESKYEEEPRSPASPGPWSDYINGIFAVLLARQNVEDIADTVYARTTEPFVDELDKREFAHRIDLARSLSSAILDNDSDEQHLDTLEQYVVEHGSDWDRARYSAYIQFIQGLLNDSKSDILAGIEGLLDFHQTHVANARDADAVQKAVALDATAMLALARREGMAITVDHEAIPAPLNNDEYYPVRKEK